MTSLELFRALGGVSTENLAGADRLQRMQTVPVRRKAPVKRAALIAAVVALLLLLVGCAAVYVLHLQDLKVGEYRPIPNPVYDKNGDVVPVGTHPLQTQLSLQGANQEALIEWSQFKRDYSPSEEPEVLAKNRATAVPDNYREVYDCTTWEMMEKLDEITSTHGLTLLSREIDCDGFESGVLFGALGIDPVYQGTAEYLDSYFYPEGTFKLYLLFQTDSEAWPYENNHAQYYFSRKSYFDPNSMVIEGFEDCTQWNYTRKDGRKILLAMNGEQAWIFADREDAFITISFSCVKWVDGAQVKMTREVLEEIAEHFDLSPQPQAVDMNQVAALKEAAKAEYDAQREASSRQDYTQGYEAYIQHCLDTASNSRHRDSLFYSLYDLNGDGVEELLPGGNKSLRLILSLRDGESYPYADFNEMHLFGIFQVTVCENGVLALKDVVTERIWYYVRAEADGVSYLEGLELRNDTWYSIPEQPPASPQQPERVKITPEEAQAIQDSYVPLADQPQWQMMKRYGQPIKTISWTDPYAQLVAETLDRFSDPESFTYALMDLNGDGVKELIVDDAYGRSNESYRSHAYEVFTIVNGERVSASDTPFNGVCENGIFMEYDEREGTYYAYYRLNGTKMEMIERIFQDPSDLYWGRVLYSNPDPDHTPYSEEDAMKFVNAYKPIDLPMKPFSEYPLH